MPEQTSADQSGIADAQSGPGISEFIGKVLDQLSLSAWLPAAMLVGVGALLMVMHGQAQLKPAAAIMGLTKAPLGILVVLLFSLVLTTMITQAFGYEAIRLLEGYWGTRAKLLARISIARNAHRRERLEEAERTLRQASFARARQRLIANAGPEVVANVQLLANVLERVVNDQRVDYQDAKVKEALAMGWRDAADPAELRQLDATSQSLATYPIPHRVLPTRLGNVLRAAEDKLERADKGDIEGLVMRNYERIPARLLAQHSQFRTRLDMYCTLVFVFAVLSVGSLAALWKFGHWHGPAWIAALLFGVLANLSYRAAVSSAKGYGSTLLAIDSGISAALRNCTS